MNWKSIWIAALVIGSVLSFSSTHFSAANADPMKRLRCNSSYCTFTEHLGKSTTREYRAVCSNGVNPYPKNMMTRHTNKDTTCTARCRAEAGNTHYISQSCTNWNPVKRDKIEITVRCGDYPDTSGGIEDTCH